MAWIKLKAVPASLVGSLDHVFPHRRMHSSYAKLNEWISGSGYRIAGPNREIYLVAPWPEGASNPEALQTEIQFPVARWEANLVSSSALACLLPSLPWQACG